MVRIGGDSEERSYPQTARKRSYSSSRTLLWCSEDERKNV